MRAKEFIVEYKQYPLEDFQGLTMKLIEQDHQLIVMALDEDWGNNELGYVIFNIGDNDELDPQDLFVNENYRGQGVARKMYDFVISHGYKIHKSPDVTKIKDQGKQSGEYFWQKHRGEKTVWEDQSSDVKVVEYHGVKFKVEEEVQPTYKETRLTAFTNTGTEMGRMVISYDRELDYWEVQNIRIKPEYQRNGLGRLMYNYLAYELGYEIHRSENQSTSGADFWDKHRPDERVWEERSHPDQNKKHWNAQSELESWFHHSGLQYKFKEQASWGVSMTVLPKLGINPNRGISEDTPKGIYFYPLSYMIPWMYHNRKELPWGNDFPYIQLFQYDNSHQLTQKTPVDPGKLRQALSQYCPEEVINQVAEEGTYNNDPYWFIYNCLVQVSKNDESTIIRWNKVLRTLGFTSVMDDGRGWIAHNERTQGVILDPRIIKQVKTFNNYARKGDPRK